VSVPPVSVPSLSLRVSWHLFAYDGFRVMSVRSGFVGDPSKALLVPPKALLTADKEAPKNIYSQTNNALRRSVSATSDSERSALFLKALPGVDFDAIEATYDDRGRMDLTSATTIRTAVLALLTAGVAEAPVLPAADIRMLRMIVCALLSFHVLQPFGESAARLHRCPCARLS
jgi:hypothetical protein